jgi:hypothetical protein
MSKFYLDILFALSISIIANIITPYLQNLLHIHAINAAHRKNRRIAALHRLAQMPSREFSGESASGSARGSIDTTIDGLIDVQCDRISAPSAAVLILLTHAPEVPFPYQRSQQLGEETIRHVGNS